MKRTSRKTQRMMWWLLLPLVAIGVAIMVDLCFDLGWQTEEWGNWAMLGWIGLMLLCYGIAAVRQRCWGEMAVVILILLIPLLRLSGLFPG